MDYTSKEELGYKVCTLEIYKGREIDLWKAEKKYFYKVGLNFFYSLRRAHIFITKEKRRKSNARERL